MSTGGRGGGAHLTARPHYTLITRAALPALGSARVEGACTAITSHQVERPLPTPLATVASILAVCQMEGGDEGRVEEGGERVSE